MNKTQLQSTPQSPEQLELELSELAPVEINSKPNTERLQGQQVQSSRDSGSTAGAASLSLFREQTVARRLREDPTLNPETKIPFEANEATGESLFQYIPVSNQDTKTEIRNKIDETGVDLSITSYLAQNDKLQLRQHSAMGVEIVKVLKEQIAEARQNGNESISAELIEKQKQVATALVDFGTDSGQAVQYLVQLQQFTNADDVVDVAQRMADKVAAKGGQDPKQLSTETRERIKVLGEKIIKLGDEESVIGRELQRELMAEVAADSLDTASVLESMWYANILSGVNTQGINLFGSGMNLFLRILGSSITNPKNLAPALRGMVDGAKRGVVDAKAALFGQDISRTMDKMNAPGALEAILRKKKLNPETTAAHLKNIGIDSIALGRFVFRTLGAGDAFFYRVGTEAKARVVAAELIRKNFNDLTSEQYAERLSNELHNSEEQTRRAEKQAELEVNDIFSEQERQKMSKGRLGSLKARRVFEILDSQRNPEILEEAKRFGELTTFTQPPEGTMGEIVKGVNQIINKAAINTRFGRVRRF